MRPFDVALATLDGPLALALGFPMQAGAVQRQTGQALGIVGGLRIQRAELGSLERPTKHSKACPQGKKPPQR
jgi:hypothetical protein